uniref:RING-type domain-containing protein n=1 Tax=Araucaria cunninghamii TaxID=56994 RepID=A0A0D6R4T2_ARACU
MSSWLGHELLEVPDTPDRLATQNDGRLSRVGGARPRGSVCFRDRRDNENRRRRDQDQTNWRNVTSGSSYDCPSLLETSSRGMQYKSRKDTYAQDEDQGHVISGSTASSSETCRQRHFCPQTIGLPRPSFVEACNKMSGEDKNVGTPNIDELSFSAQEEFKRNGKETISGDAIPTPLQKRRKMLVRNGRISPNAISNDAAKSNRGVKRLQEASESSKGSAMNEPSADADSSNNVNQVVQPDGKCLPSASEQYDKRKGKEIAIVDMVENGSDSSVQLVRSRKRLRSSLLSSKEANRLSVCNNSTSPRPNGSAGLLSEVRSQTCRNDVTHYRSRDNASEENIQSTSDILGCSRIHQNEGQSSRIDKTKGCSPFLFLEGDEGNYSEADSPEVIFLRSSRPSRRNISSASITSNVVSESSCDVVEAANHNPIDVDSLESPIHDSINMDASNGEVDARVRQIEQDEILARQLQEEFAGEVLEEGLQEYDPVLHAAVQRETREHTAASYSESGSLFPGLHASFGIGARRREPTRSLRIRPSMAAIQFGVPTAAAIRRRAPVSGLMGRSRGRSIRDRTFQFPRYMNLEMRVDMLEAMERVAESHVTHQLLAGVQRDFNEDDYEMLLSLDDNNDNHRGASERHIDRLPVTTVKNDVGDEVCSICLEMPKSGEIIRHLLCMHKFHKECIDPWLMRQASCPICKQSI